MMIDIGLILWRFLHYAAVTTLAGASLFPLYAYAASEPKEVFRWRRVLRLAAAIVALLSGVLWFVFSAANMSGSLSDLADADVVWSVARDTGFGVIWTARMLLAVIIIGVTAIRLPSTASITHDLVTSSLAALLLASLAGTGHSQIEQGWASVVHIASDAAHLLAAGAWLGGLVPLGYILLLHGPACESAQTSKVNEVLLNFSGMGYVAVATLIGSGLLNGWFLIGSVSGLYATSYGQLLFVKLGLFAGMLALAVSNRFWLAPSLAEDQEGDRSKSAGWTRQLRNHVLGEQFLGLMVLLVVSVLGTMRPAIGQ